MAPSYQELKKMTVAELRDLAAGLEPDTVQGYSQLRKDQLVPALCAALGIEAHEHHEVQGVDKAAIKEEIGRLKTRRDEALAAGVQQDYRRVLRRIHRLKRQLRKATV